MDGPMEVHNPLFDDMLEKPNVVEHTYQEIGTANGYRQNPSFVNSSSISK